MHVFETPGAVAVRVSIVAGEVIVVTSDAPRVEVDVQPLRNNAASREAVEETRVELVERGGRHEVVVDAPKKWLSLRGGASIGVRVSCPEHARLEVSTVSGDIRTTGRLGDVEVKTASGDVGLDPVDRDLRVSSASGDVSVVEVGGAGTVKTASGDVDVRLAKGALSVNSASGDVRVDRVLGSASVATASGDQEIGVVESGEIKLQSVSGDVRVGVAEGLRVWIDATSVSGSISSDLPFEDSPPSEGGAGVELRARTVSGDVRIAAAAPTPS